MVYVDDNEVKTYFKIFIEAYADAVKSAGKKGSEPQFYKDMPFKCDVYKMPNEAVVAILYTGAQKPMYEVYDGDYETLKGLIKDKKHQHCIQFFPTKNFSTDDAKADAKTAFSRDMRAATYKAGLAAAKSHVADVGKQLVEIAKANPWLEEQLNDLKKRLAKASTPLDKLSEEYKKIDQEEFYTNQAMVLSELEDLDLSDPIVADKDNVEEYINTFVGTYKAAIKPDYPEHAKPPFFKGAPFRVQAYLMPNNSVPVIFKYGAVADTVDVTEGDYNKVKSVIEAKDHQHFVDLPSMKTFTAARAKTDAKLTVKNDIRNTLHLALLRSTRKVIEEHQEKVSEIIKTSPWLEGALSTVNTRLKGVDKLLAVLIDEIENNQLNTKLADQKRILTERSRYKRVKKSAAAPAPAAPTAAEAAPVTTTAPVSEVVAEAVSKPAVEAPAPTAAVVQTEGPVFVAAPSWDKPASAIAGSHTADDSTAAFPYEAEAMGYEAAQYGAVQPGMTEDEKAAMNELRSEVYDFRKNMEEFKRKINYMDKYIEHEVQKRQDEKFREMEALVQSQIRRSTWIGTGLGSIAIILSILTLVVSAPILLAAIQSLF